MKIGDSTKVIQKVDIYRNPRSQQIKSLKNLIRIDHQIINMIIGTGSPVSFLNWATAKQTLESSKNTKFIPRENPNLTAQFVDYNKQPINILGAITTTIRSTGWEVVVASFLITERRTRCILRLDRAKWEYTQQRSWHQKFKTRFNVLLCEQPEGWKNKFYSKFRDLFDRQGCSRNHVVSTKFKYPLCPLQEKGRRVPIHIQEKVHEETEKLLKEGHILRMDKCTSDCFLASIVVTVKKYDSIKMALDAKPINRQLFKNKYQMPYVVELLDGVSQIVTANTNGTLCFSVLDLKYAYSQLKLTAETAKQSNFNIIGGKATGT